MISYDVIGYVCNGEIYCPGCAQHFSEPIFAGDEGMEGDCCAECGNELFSESEVEYDEEDN